MKDTAALLNELNPNYFWDVDIERLKKGRSSRLIIERVFSIGDMHEINLVIRFYGEERILEVLRKIPCLDPKSSNFIIKYFNKPAKEFRCYQLNRLRKRHWNS